MSNKALNKFTKFTSTKPPLYKNKQLAPSNIKKGGKTKEQLIADIKMKSSNKSE